MSEITRGVIRMPYELAMSDEFSRFQFYARANEVLDELDALRAALDEQKAAVKLYSSQWVNIVNHDNCWDLYSKEEAVREVVKMTEEVIKRNCAESDKFRPLDGHKTAPSDEELAQAMYEVAGVYVEGGEFHCRRADMPRIAKRLLSKYAAPAPKGEKVSHEWFECEVDPLPLQYTLKDYHHAVCSDGELNFIWRDKPHRLLYDLIAAVKFYAAPENEQDGGWGKEDVYEEVYDNLCSALRPHINAQKLPPSVTESVEFLVKHWASSANEQDARDAERYRNFRAAMAKSEVGFFFRIEDALKLIGVPESIAPNEDQIDAAFDAAIAQQGKEG